MSMGTLATLAQTVGGRLYGSDATFESVSTDTRTLQRGQVFFALKGEHLDGARFIAEAERVGAAGAVVQARQSAQIPQVEVADTRLALGRFARAWRSQFDIPVIGITGSNGKTTAKEMIAAIMRAHLGGNADDAVLVTWGNLNNEIGLPLTLLWLNAFHRAAVLEMGASRPGDIAYLANLAAPTIAAVTNASRAHLAGFGSVEDVAATKGELFAALAADGTAVINRDDRFFTPWCERAAGRRRLTFGLHPDADYRAEAVTQAVGPDGPELTFTLISPAGSGAVKLAMAGQHNVINALAAAAAASAAGAPLAAAKAGLEAVRNVPGRLCRIPAPGGVTVFDDSYNANPGSVRAAIQFLGSLTGERWLVLGDMAELGPESPALHREMGELARQAGIQRLFCIGTDSRAAVEAFGRGAEWHESQAALLGALDSQRRRGVVVLVKGSRRMAMERVVQALVADGGSRER
jgi:UDP-N-acetylmuramoyl-tripeptide--D-alanyl-D-alanine ligase